MREDYDGRALCAALQIFFQPLELFRAQCAQSAGFQVHHIHQADKVDAVFIEAAPARALRTFSVAIAKLLAVIVQHVVLAGNEENFLAGVLQNLIDSVEFFRLGEMADVAGVQQKFRRIGQSPDFFHGGFQRSSDILIGGLVESHVAVADLHKLQFAFGGGADPVPKDG